MSRGIKDQKEDAREVYADIIDHPHWQSPTRPHMSLYDRAAQFSPFAALTGYDDMVTEEARTVDRKIELDESETARLSRKLSLIYNALLKGSAPVVTITRFVSDPLKSGGKYITEKGGIRKIDPAEKTVVLTKTDDYGPLSVEIAMTDILEIRGDIADLADE